MFQLKQFPSLMLIAATLTLSMLAPSVTAGFSREPGGPLVYHESNTKDLNLQSGSSWGRRRIIIDENGDGIPRGWGTITKVSVAVKLNDQTDPNQIIVNFGALTSGVAVTLCGGGQFTGAPDCRPGKKTTYTSDVDITQLDRYIGRDLVDYWDLYVTGGGDGGKLLNYSVSFEIETSDGNRKTRRVLRGGSSN